MITAIGDLKPGTKYAVQFSAVDSNGRQTEWSPTYEIQTPVDSPHPAPSNIQFSYTSGNITASWDAPGEIKPDFKGYVVEVFTNADVLLGQYVVERGTSFPFSLSLNDTLNVTPIPNPKFTIRALDASGSLSTALSGQASYPTVGAPTSTNGVAVINGVNWKWSAPSTHPDIAAFYEIDVDPNGSSTWFDDTPEGTVYGYNYLYINAPGTAYDAQVRTVDVFDRRSAGVDFVAVTSLSDASGGTDVTAPTLTGNVTASGGTYYTDGTTSFKVTWPVASDPETSIAGYYVRIKRDADGSQAWTTVFVDAGGWINGHTFRNLAPSTAYNVEVAAMNGAGVRSSWIALTGTTFTTPASTIPTITSISTTPWTANDLTLSWTDSASRDSYFVGYDVEITSASITYVFRTQSKSLTVTSADWISIWGANAPTIAIGAVKVYAVNSNGAKSSPVSSTVAYTLAAPSAPSGVAVNVGVGAVDVSWSSVSTAVRYDVVAVASASGATAPTAANSVTSVPMSTNPKASFAAKVTDPAHQYKVGVVAYDAYSRASAVGGSVTTGVPNTPSAPSLSTSFNVMTATWTAVSLPATSKAVDYEIYAGTTNNPTTLVEVTPGLRSQWTTYGSATWYARVRALNGIGSASAYSTSTSLAALSNVLTDSTAPTAPSALNTTSVGETNLGRSSINVVVSTPNTEDDLGGYKVRYRLSGSTGSWSYFYYQPAVPNKAVTFSVDGLIPGTTYQVELSAIDLAGNVSTYTGLPNVTTAASADPATPAAPNVVMSASGTVSVTADSSVAPDVIGWNVYADTSGSGFTTSAANKIGFISKSLVNNEVFDLPSFRSTITGITGTGPGTRTVTTNVSHGFVNGQLVDIVGVNGIADETGRTVSGVSRTNGVSTSFQYTSAVSGTYVSGGEARSASTWYIKVAAVNSSNKVSAGSPAATATLGLIDGAVISDLTVTSAKIKDLTADKIKAGAISTEIVRVGTNGIAIDGPSGEIRSQSYSATGVSISSISGSAIGTRTVTTSAAHGLQTGDRVLISGTVGSLVTLDEELPVTVTVTTTTQFTYSSTMGGTYTSGGTVKPLGWKIDRDGSAEFSDISITGDFEIQRSATGNRVKMTQDGLAVIDNGVTALTVTELGIDGFDTDVLDSSGDPIYKDFHVGDDGIEISSAKLSTGKRRKISITARSWPNDTTLRLTTSGEHGFSPGERVAVQGLWDAQYSVERAAVNGGLIQLVSQTDFFSGAVEGCEVKVSGMGRNFDGIWPFAGTGFEVAPLFYSRYDVSLAAGKISSVGVVTTTGSTANAGGWGTITAITGSGPGTRTLTTAVAHGMLANQKMKISGVTPDALNEEVFITSVTSTTITYTSAAAGSYASGGETGSVMQVKFASDTRSPILPGMTFSIRNMTPLTGNHPHNYMHEMYRYVDDFTFHYIRKATGTLGSVSSGLFRAHQWLLDSPSGGPPLVAGDTVLCTGVEYIQYGVGGTTVVDAPVGQTEDDLVNPIVDGTPFTLNYVTDYSNSSNPGIGEMYFYTSQLQEGENPSLLGTSSDAFYRRYIKTGTFKSDSLKHITLASSKANFLPSSVSGLAQLSMSNGSYEAVAVTPTTIDVRWSKAATAPTGLNSPSFTEATIEIASPGVGIENDGDGPVVTLSSGNNSVLESPGLVSAVSQADPRTSQISSYVRTAGSTTATITTVADHGLTTGDYLEINGVTNGDTADNRPVSVTVTGSKTLTCQPNNLTTAINSTNTGQIESVIPVQAIIPSYFYNTRELSGGSTGSADHRQTVLTNVPHGLENGDKIVIETDSSKHMYEIPTISVIDKYRFQIIDDGPKLVRSAITYTQSTIPGTTVASGSNGLSLPQATINLASATQFSAFGGRAIVTTSAGPQVVTYTTKSGNALTGCSGGTGTMSTGGSVLLGNEYSPGAVLRLYLESGAPTEYLTDAEKVIIYHSPNTFNGANSEIVGIGGSSIDVSTNLTAQPYGTSTGSFRIGTMVGQIGPQSGPYFGFDAHQFTPGSTSVCGVIRVIKAERPQVQMTSPTTESDASRSYIALEPGTVRKLTPYYYSSGSYGRAGTGDAGGTGTIGSGDAVSTSRIILNAGEVLFTGNYSKSAVVTYDTSRWRSGKEATTERHGISLTQEMDGWWSLSGVLVRTKSLYADSRTGSDAISVLRIESDFAKPDNNTLVPAIIGHRVDYSTSGNADTEIVMVEIRPSGDVVMTFPAYRVSSAGAQIARATIGSSSTVTWGGNGDYDFISLSGIRWKARTGSF